MQFQLGKLEITNNLQKSSVKSNTGIRTKIRSKFKGTESSDTSYFSPVKELLKNN